LSINFGDARIKKIALKNEPSGIEYSLKKNRIKGLER